MISLLCKDWRPFSQIAVLLGKGWKARFATLLSQGSSREALYFQWSYTTDTQGVCPLLRKGTSFSQKHLGHNPSSNQLFLNPAMEDWIGEKIHTEKNPNKIMPQWNVNLWDGIYSRNRWVEGELVLFQEILLASIGSSSSLYQKDIHQGSMATWDLCLLSFSSELRAACAD